MLSMYWALWDESFPSFPVGRRSARFLVGGGVARSGGTIFGRRDVAVARGVVRR